MRFATYARYWVHASMSALLLRTTNALGSLARSRADVKRRRESGAARNFGLDGFQSLRDVSLDAPLASDNDTTLLERLVAESADVDAQIECGRRNVLVASAVADLVATFDLRERVIFDARFGPDEALNEPVGPDVVAGRLRLSRERVRQLEERVRLKLANRLRTVLEPEMKRAG